MAYPQELRELIDLCLSSDDEGEQLSPFTVALRGKGENFAKTQDRALNRREVRCSQLVINGWAEVLSIDAEVVRTVLSRDRTLVFAPRRKKVDK